MKIKFNLGWILAVAAANTVAAMGFMSAFYRTGGDLTWPIIIATLLLVLPIVVNMLLVPAKECPKPFYFHREAVKEIWLLIALVCLMVASMFCVNHFFTVNSRTKTIASTVKEQREQLEKMQESYRRHTSERTKAYKGYLNEVSRNKKNDETTYKRVFPNGANDIGLMVMNLENKISIKDSTLAIIPDDNISWWNLPMEMKNVMAISNNLENNYNTLQELDRSTDIDAIAEKDYWTYSFTPAADVMSEFKTPEGIIPGKWTVLAILVAYIFIFLPYFAAERDSRSKGLWTELFENKDKMDDDYVSSGNIGKI